MAGREGVEPPSRGPEPRALPLGQRPVQDDMHGGDHALPTPASAIQELLPSRIAVTGQSLVRPHDLVSGPGLEPGLAGPQPAVPPTTPSAAEAKSPRLSKRGPGVTGLLGGGGTDYPQERYDCLATSIHSTDRSLLPGLPSRGPVLPKETTPAPSVTDGFFPSPQRRPGSGPFPWFGLAFSPGP